MGDLFDVRRGLSESLKNYLDLFNKTTVLVEEPDEKFFVTALIKGLSSGTFSEALIIWKPRTMDEVRVRAEKHIEAKESNAGKREKESGRKGPFTERLEPRCRCRCADGGSSANVIYGKCFEELKLPSDILKDYLGTLVGFSKEQVAVHDYLILSTTFGEKDNAKTLAL